ncbi:cyclohydrolase [Auriculariales sp. MPI-PUGE-AT-0066]|nr:cyclohydrolase [Auriculariales sp. MPI-PUGE-AT-0066]
MPSVVLPSHHAGHHGCPCHAHGGATEADLQLLDALTAPRPVVGSASFKRRDAPLDPLLLAATVMSGPQVTRHHFHHGFSVVDAEVLQATVSPSSSPTDTRARYASRQAPRRERLAALSTRDVNKENVDAGVGELASPKARRNSLLSSPVTSTVQPAPIVQCLVRTRIPTAHGEVLLHLYRNNRDGKEHMAVVVDPAQLQPLNATGAQQSIGAAPAIRSHSLDARWSDSETDMDRVVRGAFVGRLSQSATSASASLDHLHALQQHQALARADLAGVAPPPLVRIHSECFTGETIGSMRCDCGEQLDEAVRRISQPVIVQTPAGPVSVPGRGVVVYMRQEGRGIGLLSKLRAYNLQDLGHDTVAANLMLGHGADERRYELAAAILRDLGIAGGDGASEDGIRLLTNNPDKIAALAAEGVRVLERAEMVPRSWRCDQATARLGTHTPRGEDLDRYLQTKIMRMGHMLHAPSVRTPSQ